MAEKKQETFRTTIGGQAIGMRSMSIYELNAPPRGWSPR